MPCLERVHTRLSTPSILNLKIVRTILMNEVIIQWWAAFRGCELSGGRVARKQRNQFKSSEGWWGYIYIYILPNNNLTILGLQRRCNCFLMRGRFSFDNASGDGQNHPSSSFHWVKVPLFDPITMGIFRSKLMHTCWTKEFKNGFIILSWTQDARSVWQVACYTVVTSATMVVSGLTVNIG